MRGQIVQCGPLSCPYAWTIGRPRERSRPYAWTTAGVVGKRSAARAELTRFIVSVCVPGDARAAEEPVPDRNRVRMRGQLCSVRGAITSTRWAGSLGERGALSSARTRNRVRMRPGDPAFERTAAARTAVPSTNSSAEKSPALTSTSDRSGMRRQGLHSACGNRWGETTRPDRVGMRARGFLTSAGTETSAVRSPGESVGRDGRGLAMPS